MKQITIPAQVDCLYTVLEFIGNLLKEAGINESLRINIAVVTEEIFVNIASYAYGSGEGEANIRIEVGLDKVHLEFRDSGIPYNPLEKQDPDISLAADERKIGGLGIYMAKKMMDSVKYRYEDGMNILTVEKQTSAVNLNS